MSKSNLKGLKRVLKEKKDGFVAAVLYGKGIENEVLWIDEREFEKVYKAAGGSTLVDVYVGDDKDKRAVLIYDVQIHPTTDKFTHIDFFQVDMSVEIETDIKLTFSGVSSAVNELGGTFVKSLDKIAVRCLPADLVGGVEVDISVIDAFDKFIHVSDLKIPKGIEVLTGENITVALVTAPRTAADMEELDEEIDADISQVEGMEEKTEEGEEAVVAEDKKEA